MQLGDILKRKEKHNRLVFTIIIFLSIFTLLVKSTIDFGLFFVSPNAASFDTQINLSQYSTEVSAGIYSPWRGKATITGQLPVDKVTQSTINIYVDGVVTPITTLNTSSLPRTQNIYNFTITLDTNLYSNGYHSFRVYDGTVSSIPNESKNPLIEVPFYVDNSLAGKTLAASNLRPEPNTSKPPIILIPQDANLEIVEAVKGESGTVSFGTTDIWYKIIYKTLSGNVYEGYVLSALVSLYSPGILSMKTQSPNSALVEFDPFKTTYDFHLPYSSGYIEFKDIVKTHKDDTLSVKLNGKNVSAPYKLDLKTGDNKVEITYTASAGSSASNTNYTYNIWRIAESVEAEFQAQLAKFPESYRGELLRLHSKYPNWVFIADPIDYSWDYVISSQDSGTTSLIWYSRPKEYIKSSEIKDGTSFVTASRAAVEYYMDPRNFLNEERIFQFEDLSYDQVNHNLEGIGKILAGSGLAGKEQMFLNAAKDSNVSPYHLASRSRLEVSVGTGLSVIATGNYTKFNNIYKGYYNFYNIGTYSSTNVDVLLSNGLNFARGYYLSGSNWVLRTSDNLNLYHMPWNTEQRAITGGAIYIGNWYINAGQNTMYYQKFNPLRPGVHQYMQNIEAPFHESLSVYRAYKDMNAVNTSITFKIPVYKDMPTLKTPRPDDSNKLNALSVGGQQISPTFNPDNNGPYTLSVPFNMEEITINATALNSNANITGTGKKTLKEGLNTFTVSVTPLNGEKRNYTLRVTRKPPESSSENRLENLTLSTGTLSPKFASSTTGPYKTTVGSDESTITINASAMSPISKVSGTGLKELRYGLNDYSITVTAENGEKRIYRVQITRKFPELKPNEYIFEDKTLRGVEISTNVTTFIKSIASSEHEIKAFNGTGKELSGSDILGTGTKIIIYVDGEKTNEYQTIILGDVNGDGRVNSTDIALARAHILRISELSGIPFNAADINGDKRINSTDIALMRAHILRMSEINQKQ